MLQVLDRVRAALVLVLGQHELRQAGGSGTERLKRLLKAANPLLDAILAEPPPLSMIADAPEVILVRRRREMPLYNYFLAAAADAASALSANIGTKDRRCSYCIVYRWPYHRRYTSMVRLTNMFSFAINFYRWEIDARDIAMVMLYLTVLPSVAARDNPVYLPHTQPNVCLAR